MLSIELKQMLWDAGCGIIGTLLPSFLACLALCLLSSAKLSDFNACKNCKVGLMIWFFGVNSSFMAEQLPGFSQWLDRHHDKVQCLGFLTEALGAVRYTLAGRLHCRHAIF